MRFIRTKAARRGRPRPGRARSRPAATPAATTASSVDVKVDKNAADELRRRHPHEGARRRGQDHDRREVRPARASASRARPTTCPTGFDPEIAKILAAGARHRPGSDKSSGSETISDNREPFLQKGKVDLVLASYSITDERRAVVGQAGPYYVTGQQLLVKKDSDIKSIDDIKGKEVCSVTGLDLAGQRRGQGRQAASASTPTPSASTRCSTAPSTR